MSSSIPDPASGVWHITWEYPPQYSGGLGVACAGLVHALDQLDTSVKVFSPCMMGQPSIPNQRSSYDYNLFPLSNGEELLRTMLAGEQLTGKIPGHPLLRFSHWVLSHLVDEAPTLVHAHDWQSIVVGVAIQRMLGIPLLVHIHSTHIERMGKHVSDTLFDLEKWGLQQADMVVAVSQMTKNILCQYYGINIVKIRVITNGHGVPNDLNSQIHTSKSAKKRSIDIMWVGRFCAQKDPVFMLEVFQALKKRVSDVNLRMVGSGEYVELLQKLIDFKGLRTSVEMFPMLKREEVLKFFANAKVLCLTSRSEPFGLVALEAAEAGCHCVMSSECGAAEVLKSATVLPLDDFGSWVRHLESLMRNIKSINLKQDDLYKEAASATWEDAAEKCREIYCELLDRNCRLRPIHPLCLAAESCNHRKDADC